MSPDAYGLIEMVFSFGVVVAFAFWQLYALKRSKSDDRKRSTDETKDRDKE